MQILNLIINKMFCFSFHIKTSGFCLLFISLISCSSDSKTTPTFSNKLLTNNDLKAHSHSFEKQIIEAAPGIHIAIGYGLANSILIEGKGGNIIVDCMESSKTASEVKKAFDSISDQPTKAIIYTHFHPDHTFGAKAMAGDDKPMIVAHETTQSHIEKLVNVIRPIITKRSYRMFGNLLDQEALVNAGIGPFLGLDTEVQWGVLKPNKTFATELEIELAGVPLKLVHAPGETDDQIFVWIADRKILLSGDNIYKTFPNLYTIRGTSYRDIKKWAKSLDKMRYLEPEILIPSHTKPIHGKDSIYTALTQYRDAIQYVHDQTIRHINKGETPDEIAENVQLPANLQSSPYLKEFYGRVDWSVKSVFNGYLGFFDGNPSTLLPLKRKEKATNMAKLAGGYNQLKSKAQKALDNKELQWALELTDFLLVLEPKDQEVSNIRYSCLIGLGEASSNPNARHYYLTSALELKGLEIPNQKATEEVAQTLTLQSIFDGLAVNLIPEKSTDIHQKVVFHFTDIDSYWSIQVRNNIAEIQNFKIPEPDIAIAMKSSDFKNLVTGVDGGMGSYFSGKMDIQKGSLLSFKSFFDMFKE